MNHAFLASKFRTVFIASLLFALLAVTGKVLADPAAQVARDFTQPDGSAITLHLWGDEYVNGWETTDGYSVALNPATGYWEYANRDGTGNLTLTGLRPGVDAAPAPPHVRPSQQVIDARREAMGAVEFQPGTRQAPPWANGPTNILVIKVQFPADPADPNGPQPAVDCSFTADQTRDNLFGPLATGPGNMTDYYDQISFGNLHLQGTVVGCFTSANDKNDYDDGPSSDVALVTEAIQLADPSVDFSSFDNDGDGEVDMVAIVYAGNGPDNGLYDGADPNVNNLWPHASSIPPVAVDGGARTVRQYYIVPELLNSAPTQRTIGVHCHEFGHKLGLPDLYDTDGSSQGVGHWCLMGSGSWTSNTPGIENGQSPASMSAWCKWKLAWISPTELTGQKLAQDIPEAENNAFAVQLLDNPGGADDWPGGTGQYFLIENRQRTNFDIGLDGCGLLVWHVDESLNGNSHEGHTEGSHRLLDLEEADGTPQDLDQPDPFSNRGDTGDPFPGSTNNLAWNDGTDPNSRLYNGDATGILVDVLTHDCAATMTIGLGDHAPVADAGNDTTVECTSHDGTAVMLDGTGSYDPDGDPLQYTWSASGVTFDDPHSATPTGLFTLGVTTVTLTVFDGIEEDTDTVQVTIQDTTPPTIEVALSRYELWPPNHKLVEIDATVQVTDTCCDDPSFVLTSITSDEPDEGTGDGDRPNDIQQADFGTADVAFLLRSERSGQGDGRVYTITYTATDCSGNTADSVVEVRVPHDLRGGLAKSSLGFNPSGEQFDPSATTFALVLLTVPDGPSAFDATQVVRDDLPVGNTAGVTNPYAVLIEDADRDGHDDLIAMYSISRALPIVAASDSLDGSLGLHYRLQGGADYLADNVFALGAPMQLDGGLFSGIGDGPDFGNDVPLPRVTALAAVSPNPVRPNTVVSYEIAHETPVELGVYDVRGALVRTLVKESRAPGVYHVAWDGRDAQGQRVASGTYFVRLQADRQESMRKVIMLQ